MRGIACDRRMQRDRPFDDRGRREGENDKRAGKNGVPGDGEPFADIAIGRVFVLLLVMLALAGQMDMAAGNESLQRQRKDKQRGIEPMERPGSRHGGDLNGSRI